MNTLGAPTVRLATRTCTWDLSPAQVPSVTHWARVGTKGCVQVTGPAGECEPLTVSKCDRTKGRLYGLTELAAGQLGR